MHPRIPLAFLAARARCCLMVNLSSTSTPSPSLQSCSPAGPPQACTGAWGCSFPGAGSSPCLLNHVPKCPIYMFFEPFQGWGLHHCPGQPGATPDHSSSKKNFPTICSKLPLLQLAAISSHSIASYLGEETNTHPVTTVFQVVDLRRRAADLSECITVCAEVFLALSQPPWPDWKNSLSTLTSRQSCCSHQSAFWRPKKGDAQFWTQSRVFSLETNVAWQFLLGSSWHVI